MRIPAMRDWPLGTQIAAACLLAALALDLAVVTGLRHLREEDVVSQPTIRPAPRIMTRTLSDPALIHDAANKTPFDLETPVVTSVATVVPPVAPTRPRLVGTVVQGRDGGFVIVELPDARMQVVRIGERAAGLRLRSVSAGEAVFDDLRGGRVSLRTLAPGSDTHR